MECTHSLHMDHVMMADNSAPVQTILRGMNSRLTSLERSLAEELIQQQKVHRYTIKGTSHEV